MIELTDHDLLAELRRRLAQHSRSNVDLWEHVLDRLERLEKRLFSKPSSRPVIGKKMKAGTAPYGPEMISRAYSKPLTSS